MALDGGDLRAWWELAEEVERRHRRGHVLALDPALVLRGLPPRWRPAGEAGGPADDVVALAGAALARLPRDGGDLRRPPLVEAAAGCGGADLPALLRTLRALGPSEHPGPGATTGAGDGRGDRTGGDDDDRDGRPHPVERPAGARSGGPARGRRLGVLGALAAAALATVGLVGGGSPHLGRAGAAGPPLLTAEPSALGTSGAAAAWDPPHLVVEVGGIRWRYRAVGRVDAVVVEDGPGGPALVATADGHRWPLDVPALARTPDAAGPGRPDPPQGRSAGPGAGPGGLSGSAGPR